MSLNRNSNIVRNFTLLFFSWFIFSSALLFGQDNARESDNFFNRNSWEETVKDIDYTETFKQRKPKEKGNKEEGQNEITPRQRKMLSPSAGGGFIRIFLFVVIAGVLSFLIYLILKNSFNFFSERVPDTKLDSIVENLEENLHNTDFENLLQQAVSNGEFRLAVRIFYLHIIKTLSDLDLIKWKKEKTNGHYIREMFQHSSGQKFSFLTAIYEQSWFGSKVISESNYKLIANEFENYLKELN